MATARKIQAPGIQKNEIDRSQYDNQNKVDYSLPNAPTVLVTGFSDKGEDLTIQWINSYATLNNSYGTPTTEFEKYFYNGISEVLNRGGTCLAARLPYNNQSYKKYNYIDYNAKLIQLTGFTNGSFDTIRNFQAVLRSVITYLRDHGKYIDDTFGTDSINGLYQTTQYLYDNADELIDNELEEEFNNIINGYNTDDENLGGMFARLSSFVKNINDDDDPMYTLFLNDTNITSYLSISLDGEWKTEQLDLNSVVSSTWFSTGGKQSIEYFDKTLIGESAVPQNTIRIYDMLRSEYDQFENSTTFIKTSCDNETSSTNVVNDFLGIVPIIVTPANALFFQGLLTFNNTELSSHTDELYNPCKGFASLQNDNIIFNYYQTYNETEVGANNTTTTITAYKQNIEQMFTLPIASLNNEETKALSIDCHDQESLSKQAVDTFPFINYDDNAHFEIDNLKNIGIVVFKAFRDTDNGNKISFSLVESFVGSLDRDATDMVTKQNIFIDDIVNSQSKYIRVISNVKKSDITNTSIAATSNQPIVSMGFYNVECKKTISYVESIIESLTYIMNNASNYHNYPCDVIIDAGVSNIAQLVQNNGGIIDTSNKSRISQYEKFNLNGYNDAKYWKLILKKFDDFVKYTRKDCMFVADGLRPFCLNGNYKLVRKTSPSNTVANSIIPKLKWMSNVLDSSYSAGYCNWFYQQDASSQDMIWLPPSIKAMGVYIYCDTYFYPWSAPAGMVRGKLNDVVDIAFVPLEDEAGKIYTAKWNYAMSYPMDGIILEGHKTFQTDKTALDRINVRRLLLNLEKKVVRAARYFTYEHNTSYLRQRFVDNIRPIFEDAVQRDGVKEYAIKCDDELNTPQVIDNNEMRCRIAIKPVKCIDYILIDFICTRQSANVSEEVLR